jgi:hypothetical protein
MTISRGYFGGFGRHFVLGWIAAAGKTNSRFLARLRRARNDKS